MALQVAIIVFFHIMLRRRPVGLSVVTISVQKRIEVRSVSCTALKIAIGDASWSQGTPPVARNQWHTRFSDVDFLQNFWSFQSRNSLIHDLRPRHVRDTQDSFNSITSTLVRLCICVFTQLKCLKKQLKFIGLRNKKQLKSSIRK